MSFSPEKKTTYNQLSDVPLIHFEMYLVFDIRRICRLYLLCPLVSCVWLCLLFSTCSIRVAVGFSVEFVVASCSATSKIEIKGNRVKQSGRQAASQIAQMHTLSHVGWLPAGCHRICNVTQEQRRFVAYDTHPIYTHTRHKRQKEEKKTRKYHRYSLYYKCGCVCLN